ncbi:MAG: hypothetical protein HQK96_08620 [Nitrospirae bacterium]|nr:hypothetical protein [Nitrospirota bacterium]
MSESSDEKEAEAAAKVAKVAAILNPLNVELAAMQVVIRDMIKDENALTNNRMTSMIAINALLFTALNYTWEKTDAKALSHLISIVGWVASIFNVVMIILSSRAIQRLLLLWRFIRPENYEGPGVMGAEPPFKRDKKAIFLYVTPWVILALLFFGAWSYIWLGLDFKTHPVVNSHVVSCQLGGHGCYGIYHVFDISTQDRVISTQCAHGSIG